MKDSDQEWLGKALCREIDPEEFYPPGNEYVTAAMVCRVCPVINQCLDYALEFEASHPAGGRHGMFGGLNPLQREREAERRRSVRAARVSAP